MLTAEQAEILRFNKNWHNLPITRQAGTGKSSVVNSIVLFSQVPFVTAGIDVCTLFHSTLSRGMSPEYFFASSTTTPGQREYFALC